MTRGEEDRLLDQLFVGEIQDETLNSAPNDQFLENLIEKNNNSLITTKTTSTINTSSNNAVDPAIQILPDFSVIDRERKLIAEVEVNPKSWSHILDSISLLIQDYPFYGSLYNNRAQLLRLMGLKKEALEDLSSVISLCSNQLSKYPANSKELRYLNSTLQKAYLQRAAIHKTLKKEALSESEANAYEETIRQDLEIAGDYGHEKAKKMAAQLNPYAKLCSQMVTQMMKSLPRK